MIAKNPDLKPTTAIKKIGISDPSIIRRLRDKFAAERETLMMELQPAKRPQRHRQLPPPPSQMLDYQAEPRTMALNSNREPVKTQQPSRGSKTKKKTRPASGKTSKKPKDTVTKDNSDQFLPSQFRPDDSAVRIVAAGVRSASAIFNFQLVLATQFLQFPLARTALKSQCSFTDALFGFSGPQPALKTNAS
ncbi:MAG: hypothetical protein K0U74_05200 [Alphaproteobacteria bacterium]|nr:hypothetical protein [Alphaproteobacteria bacterium]